MAIRVSAISFVAVILLFIGLGFAAFEIGKILPRNQYNEEIITYRKAAQDVVKQYSDSMNKIARQHEDSFAVLKKVIQKKDVKINTLMKDAVKIKRENVQLVSKFLVAADSAPPVCDPVVDACKKALAGKDKEIANKDNTIAEMASKDTTRIREIGQLQMANLAQLQRADSLDRTIKNFPKPKILFKIIDVTPTQAFGIGAAISFVLTVLVIH